MQANPAIRLHSDHMQLTIHPSILFYKCVCSASIKEDMVHISTDKVHNKPNGLDIFNLKVIYMSHTNQSKREFSAGFKFSVKIK